MELVDCAIHRRLNRCGCSAFFALTDEDSFRCFRKRVEAETGRVDVLVHCAASGVHREAAALTPRHLSWTLSLNVVGAHRAVYELLPLMPSGGRIIGISSMGATRAVEYYAAVGASKGALEALFRHYARELAPRGIAVNLVSPGLVLTDVVEALPECERRTMGAQARTPTGRLTTPEDVAGIVRFLCTPAGAQIVGDTIVVDGGRRLLI